MLGMRVLAFNETGSEMSEKSQCCDALIDKDATGDKICTVCGLIMDNYPKEETQT